VCASMLERIWASAKKIRVGPIDGPHLGKCFKREEFEVTFILMGDEQCSSNMREAGGSILVSRKLGNRLPGGGKKGGWTFTLEGLSSLPLS